jgi:hypothetical protein
MRPSAHQREQIVAPENPSAMNDTPTGSDTGVPAAVVPGLATMEALMQGVRRVHRSLGKHMHHTLATAQLVGELSLQYGAGFTGH